VRSGNVSLNFLQPQSTRISFIMRGQDYDDVEMVKEKLARGASLFPDAPSARTGLRKQVIDGACILLNIASTVTLVFLNKWYVCEED
jgi:hypothetical protein